MLDKIKSYIREYNMINKGDRIVAGVSGGADSVCLFHVLLELKKEYSIQLFVVHIHHGLRPVDADRDEAYVKELCKRHAVFCHSVRADVSGLSQREGLSLEEAGRVARYEEFYRFLQENKCNKIAIAHNKNDNAETFLFNLFRGSGLTGLRGIPPVRNEIIRPLLAVEREEIEHYLRERAIEYCNDSTNSTDDYSRNQIRNQILSYAKENLNKEVIEHITMASGRIREANEFIEKQIEKCLPKILIQGKDKLYRMDVEELKKEDRIIQRGIVRRFIENLGNGLKDIDFLHIELVLSLMEKEVGKTIHLPYGLAAVREYETILLNKASPSVKKESFSIEIIMDMEENKSYHIPITGQTINVRLLNYKKSMIFPRNGCTKWFDYDKIKNTVLIRSRLEGDYIEIDGKGSRKKIKSLFIDEKIPKESRSRIPLIADGSHIMWVLGHRMSEGYKISENTKLVLEISLDGGN